MKKEFTTYREYLTEGEKSYVTIEKYMRDILYFFAYAGDRKITKELTVGYKQKLIASGYAPASVNSMLSALNSYLEFAGYADCKVKRLRTQHRVYCKEERELTKAEYYKLLRASRNDSMIYLIMQTLCGTGIRVSELKFFTVEGVRAGEINVRCKNKNRVIIIPGQLRRMLLDYAEKRKIRNGMIFVARGGKEIDRSVVWRKMKRISQKAGINAGKVFPHNLRKLFARTFYSADKDIAKLADVLGHSSINTTRIYIMTTGVEHRRYIERLGLIDEVGDSEKQKTT